MHPKTVVEATNEVARGDGYHYSERTDVRGYPRAKAKPEALSSSDTKE